MPKTLSTAAVDALARDVRSVIRDGPAANRRRILDALGPNRPGFARLLELLQDTLRKRTLSGRDAAWVRSLSDLPAAQTQHLTHFIAFGLDGDTVTLMLDLPRASAREAVAALTGSEREISLSPNAAARALGISRTHLRHLMDNGIIAFGKVGSHHRIASSEVARLKTEWDRRSRSLAEAAVAGADIDT